MCFGICFALLLFVACLGLFTVNVWCLCCFALLLLCLVGLVYGSVCFWVFVGLFVFFFCGFVWLQLCLLWNLIWLSECLFCYVFACWWFIVLLGLLFFFDCVVAGFWCVLAFAFWVCVLLVFRWVLVWILLFFVFLFVCFACVCCGVRVDSLPLRFVLIVCWTFVCYLDV